MISAVKMLSAQQRVMYIVDGSGFIFRAYHSLPPLSRRDGTPVGAVYGFTNMLLKLKQDITRPGGEHGGVIKDGYIAVVFDHARRNFRNDIYADYKATRPPTPEDLIPQFPLVRDAVSAIGVPQMEVENFEADDVIATLARKAAAAGVEVVIVSSDKDLMQLIAPGISMYDPVKQKKIGTAEVMEKFGVGPDKVIEVQSLIGDSSDNVPGVPGIGPKTAAELINEYGTLEGVLANVENIKQPKRREALRDNAELARISRTLVTLRDDVPLPLGLEELHAHEGNEGELEKFLSEQGFTSLLARVAGSSPVKPVEVKQPEKKQYHLVQDENTLQEWISKAYKAGMVAFDTETTGLDVMTAELVGFSLGLPDGEACYVPLAHVGEIGGLLAEPVKQIQLKRALELITSLLADEAVLKIGHNIKYDLHIMRRYGLDITPVADTMLISYLLDGSSNRHNMDDLAELHLGIKTISYSEVTAKLGKNATFANVNLASAVQYAAEDADVTMRLFQKLRPRLRQQKMVALYERIERPLVHVLAGMEERGICVDVSKLRDISQEFARRMNVLEQEAYNLAGGQEFNLGSPKQIGEILFENLGIAGGKKSKSGSYNTGAEILEELAEQGHRIAACLLEWRQLSKLRGTYADSLQKQINQRTGRVHTSYSMAVTSTGRLSSNDPNLQNIPVRTEDGRRIRGAFVAAPGHVLISADYSQVELRLLAHMADIASLKQAFVEGRDIHSITASQIFGIPLDKVDSNNRRAAKTINFGIIYGMSAFGLAARLGVGRGEAGSIIDAYFKQYPGIREYMEICKAKARELGYVSTLFGRRCYLPGIKDRNQGIRSFAERAAINAPLQGTAADIMKKAMIITDKALQSAGMGNAMLLQVHDELLLEAPSTRADEVAALVKKSMESAANLSVPLTVETGMGANWDECH